MTAFEPRAKRVGVAEASPTIDAMLTAACDRAAASAAGVSEGAPAPPRHIVGAVYPKLPGGCVYDPAGAMDYCNYSGFWFSPAYGGSRVYDREVPAP